MSKGSIWSGLALIIAGGVFIAGNPWPGTGLSKLWLIVGGLIIVSGLLRVLQVRQKAPPPV